MSKYNNKKVTVDGITFDSEKEAMYYELLKEQKAKGEVIDFEVQPKYTLQPSFKKNGVLHRAITYSADFKVIKPVMGFKGFNKEEVIDIKGMQTDIFRIKQKLFEYKYPELSLILLKYSKLDGGFVSPEVYKAGVAKRKIERAEKKAEKERLKKEKLDKKNNKA